MEKSKVKDLLERYADDAGLSSSLESFPREFSLVDSFAQAPFFMAPMAGVSDAAWRIMARAGGASLAYSEMVSVAGIHYKSDKTWELVDPHKVEPDIAVQLFGSKPDQFAYAAREVQARLGSRLVLIDINMACPVPKVTKKGEGSALLDTPELAANIVMSCIDALKGELPVTVKIRRGRREGEELAPEFAARMQDAGAAAIAVHGRYASQLYRGEADWSCVQRVAEAVRVPVIASGDILDAARASRVRAETGASAAMIARGTYGNPWIFRDAARFEQNVESARDIHMRLSAFRLHVRLLVACNLHIARARSLAAWYFRGIPNAAEWRARSMSCTTAEDFILLANSIEANNS